MILHRDFIVLELLWIVWWSAGVWRLFTVHLSFSLATWKSSRDAWVCVKTTISVLPVVLLTTYTSNDSYLDFEPILFFFNLWIHISNYNHTTSNSPRSWLNNFLPPQAWSPLSPHMQSVSCWKEAFLIWRLKSEIWESRRVIYLPAQTSNWPLISGYWINVFTVSGRRWKRNNISVLWQHWHEAG